MSYIDTQNGLSADEKWESGVVEDLWKKNSMIHGALIFSAHGEHAIVKHSPCAVPRSGAISWSLSKAHKVAAVTAKSLRNNPPGIGSQRIRAFSACPESVSFSSEKDMGLTEAKPALNPSSTSLG